MVYGYIEEETLTDKETRDLLKNKHLEENREKIIKANFGLVVDIANKIPSTVDIEDRIQAGMIGINKAIENFDVKKSGGAKFTTYAYYAIRSEIIRELENNSGNIHIPRRVNSMIKRVNEAKMELNEEGKNETIENIFEKLKDEFSYKDLETLFETKELREKNLKRIDSEEEFIPLDIPKEEYVEEIALRNELEKSVDRALDTLSPVLEKIVRHRFSIGGAKFMTYEELGKELNLSRERVRQLTVRSLEELGGRRGLRRQRLYDLYYEKEA